MEEIESVYDLVLIGGGPAGSAAGRAAGKRGLRTLVLEKERFPRYKPCAGALSERAIAFLDFPIPERIREKDIFGTRVCYNNRVMETNAFHRFAVTVTRSALDEYLLMKAAEAGAEIRMDEKVLDLREHASYVEVRTEETLYRAKYVVITEGAQGKLKRVVRPPDSKDRCALSIVTEIEAENGEVDRRLPGLLEFHIDPVRMGYYWIFPHDGYYSIGIWGFSRYLHDSKRLMKEFMIKNGFTSDYRLQGRLVPVGGRRRKVASSRIALAGDAAGYVEPFTGEGIAYAIRSGQIAADTIANIVTDGSVQSRLGDYARSCEQIFARNFTYTLMMTRTIYRAPSFFFNLLAADREARNAFVGAPAMKRQYLSYLVWLLPRLPKILYSLSRHGNDLFPGGNVS